MGFGDGMKRKRKRRLLVPRDEIAWFPEIDMELCNGCGDCEVLCKPGVFVFGKQEGVKRPQMSVAHPYNCLVQCTRCQPICPSGAIRLPCPDDFEQFIEYVD